MANFFCERPDAFGFGETGTSTGAGRGGAGGGVGATATGEGTGQGLNGDFALPSGFNAADDEAEADPNCGGDCDSAAVAAGAPTMA